MNPKQARAIERLTRNITRASQTNDGLRWMNGPVVFRIEEKPGEALWFYATNLTSGHRWFESTVSVMAVIGERGGVALYNAEGMGVKYAIGRCTDRTARLRGRRPAKTTGAAA